MTMVPCRGVASGLMLIAAFAVGCSGGVSDRPEIAPVSGVVTYQGQTVPDAVVTFSKAGAPRKASGKTDAEGRFRLTTFNTNDGAVIGEHAVTVSKLKGPPPPALTVDTTGPEYTKAMEAAAKAPAAETGLPEKYADPEKSGLKNTVTSEGPNDFKIELQ